MERTELAVFGKTALTSTTSAPGPTQSVVLVDQAKLHPQSASALPSSLQLHNSSKHDGIDQLGASVYPSPKKQRTVLPDPQTPPQKPKVKSLVLTHLPLPCFLSSQSLVFDTPSCLKRKRLDSTEKHELSHEESSLPSSDEASSLPLVFASEELSFHAASSVPSTNTGPSPEDARNVSGDDKSSADTSYLMHCQSVYQTPLKKEKKCPKQMRQRTSPQQQAELDRYPSRVIASAPFMPYTNISQHDMMPVRIVGEGSFGTVREMRVGKDQAQQKEENAFSCHVALKTQELLPQAFSLQSTFLTSLVNKTLCSMSGVVTTPDSIVKVFRVWRDGTTLFTLMELCHTSLDKCTRLIEINAWKLLEQVGTALHHLHQHGLVHNDVKPGNIGVVFDTHVNENPSFKLMDFGSATPMHTVAGHVNASSLFMSPELLVNDDIASSSPVDVYSLGLTVLGMLTGWVYRHHPERILNVDVHLAYFHVEVSHDLKSVIEGMLQTDVSQRWTFPEILSRAQATNHM